MALMNVTGGWETGVTVVVRVRFRLDVGSRAVSKESPVLVAMQ